MFNHKSSVGGKLYLREMFLRISLTVICMFPIWEAYAQSPRISIQVKHKTVMHVLQQIHQKTGVRFFYNIEELKKLPRVSLDVSNETVDQVLHLLLKDLPLQAVHTNDVIAIVPVRAAGQPSAGTTTITGRITDQNGDPLPYATILKKGTTTGVTSNSEGRFVLEVEPGTVLQASFVGMQTRIVELKDQRSLHIVMQPSSASIHEVVVNGYSNVKQQYTAASATSLNGSDLDRIDQVSVDNMLQGRVTGLNINMNSTVPGAAPKIRLRGTATLLGSREPVWVIDGIISEPPVKLDALDINSLDNLNLMSSPIAGLNVKDIERIDVLKDAAAVALYGVNGGNGVIVITTRKGTFSRPPQISFSQMTNVIFRPTYRKSGLMNAAQRIALSKEAIDSNLSFTNGVLPPGFERDYQSFLKGEITAAAFDKLEQQYKEMNTDWFDILFRNGVTQRYHLAVNGGSARTAYYASASYVGQQGPAVLTGGKQYTGMARIDQRITSRLHAGIKLAGSNQKGWYPYRNDPYQYACNTARSLPYMRNGERVYYNPSPFAPNWSLPNYVMDTAQLAQFNIMTDMENSRTRTALSTYNAVMNADWHFLRSFKLQGLYGFGSSYQKNSTYAGENTFYIANTYRLGLAPGLSYTDGAKENILLPAGGEYKEAATQQRNYTIRHSLEYSTKAGRHFVQVLAGNELREATYDISKRYLIGYYPDGKPMAPTPSPDEYPLHHHFLDQSGYEPSDNLEKKYRQSSWYGMLIYSYKDRYTLNVNLRADGANYFRQLDADVRQRTWSAAVKWDISREPWLQHRPPGLLALRFSYGYNNGLPEVTPPQLAISPSQEDPVSGENQAVVRNFANPGLRWEKTYTLNAGLDFSFFRNRFFGTVEAYRKQSNDLLANINLAEENGVNSFALNSAGLLNYGMELNLQWQILKNTHWQWSAGTNLSFNYTKTLQTNFTDPGIIGNQQQYLSGNLIRSGEDPNTMYAFKFTGLDDKGIPVFRGIYDRDYTVQPTVAEYFANVFVPVGRRIPRVDGSFFTKARYRNWSLSAYFLVKLGYVQRLNKLYGEAGFIPNAAENAAVAIQHRWMKPGDENHTNIPAMASQQGVYIFDPLTMTPIQYYPFDPYNARYFAQIAPLYLMSTQLSDMYNNSDIRVVNAGHIRLSTLSLQYALPVKAGNTLIKSLAGYLQFHDLLLFANKRLQGQDPELPAGVMPRRPSLTIGTDINF